MDKGRCAWAQTHELLIAYHDREWGVPVHDDRLLFEMLNLEGAQTGLSWLTVLRKRDNYRCAFDGFDAARIARYSSAKRALLLADAGIVRNRLKIDAVIANARAFLALRDELGSFNKYLWAFVAGKPLRGNGNPRVQAVSQELSKDLKARGFKLVGPTICYAFMQAVGLVDDHAKDCFRAKRARAIRG